MSTTTQPPTGTGNFFGLKQQADTAAKVYMDNVGRHDRRALPKEQESRDKMKEIQNRVNEHVRANSIFSVLRDCVESSKHTDPKYQVQGGAVIQLYSKNWKQIKAVAFPENESLKKKRKRKESTKKDNDHGFLTPCGHWRRHKSRTEHKNFAYCEATKKDYPANKTIHSQRATMGNQKAAHRQRMQGGE